MRRKSSGLRDIRKRKRQKKTDISEKKTALEPGRYDVLIECERKNVEEYRQTQLPRLSRHDFVVHKYFPFGENLQQRIFISSELQIQYLPNYCDLSICLNILQLKDSKFEWYCLMIQKLGNFHQVNNHNNQPFSIEYSIKTILTSSL